MRAPIPHDGTATDVLVIDDNPQIREALGLLLTEAGYRVTVAPDEKADLIITRELRHLDEFRDTRYYDSTEVDD